MPNYGIVQAGGTLPTALQPGDSMYLFNAESPTPPQASVAFARGFDPAGSSAPIVFTASWAVSPTAVLNIQASNVDADAQYITLGTINASPGYYSDQGGFAFYRAQLASQSVGGAITVRVQR